MPSSKRKHRKKVRKHRVPAADPTFAAPLTHTCGCTILWSIDNNTSGLTILKMIVFGQLGKYPCPFCGGESGQDVGNPTAILMNIHGHEVLCRKTSDPQDKIDGLKNSPITGLFPRKHLNKM